MYMRTVYQSSTVKEHDRAPERLKVKAEVFSLLTTYQANISEVYHLLNVCHCLVNFFYTNRLIWIMTVCTALYWDNGLSFIAIKYSRYVSSGAQPFAIAGSSSKDMSLIVLSNIILWSNWFCLPFVFDYKGMFIIQVKR